MINQNLTFKFLISGLFFILLLTLSPILVNAGCCVTSAGCVYAASQADCTVAPSTYYSDACSAVDACSLGCCCSGSQGVGSLKKDCLYPYSFFPQSVQVGAPCSCEGFGYFISGVVTQLTGEPVVSATVSAGGKINLTNQYGRYNLTNITSGNNVRVTASKQGCVDNSVYINLSRDMTNVNIILNCNCIPGGCSPAQNAYCNSSGVWRFYDLTIQSQKDTYCTFCREFDSDCPQELECKNNDGKCPTGCAASTDSDCACSSTPNGVCPAACSSSQSDANYDADCFSRAVSCGDGIVAYPYETCERNPAPGQLSLCLPDQCIISGTAPCNCRAPPTCGNMIIDVGEECERGMFCPNGQLCNEDCQCLGFNCNGTRVAPMVSVSFDSSLRRIVLNWSVYSSCKSYVSSYAIYRCENTSSQPRSCSSKTDYALISNTLSSGMYDSSIFTNSQYCYYVQAFYGPPLEDFIGESNIICQRTGDAICMEPHPTEFCLNNARYTCDSNNNLKLISNCGTNAHCIGPDRDGRTNCTSVNICDQCNGLYGMFANLDLKVVVNSEPLYCEPAYGREIINSCYKDRTKTLFSAFKYCADVSSCYDYKSKQACEDPLDPCGKNKGCEWVWLFANTQGDPPFGGIFGGICRPKSVSLQKCEYCSNPQYNWLSPECNPHVCSLFGECYYQGSSETNPGAPSCTSSRTFNCLNYNNEANCTGGRPVGVNAVYTANNASGIRIGGTHTLIQSKDVFGLGKCYWDNVNRKCRRNADNLPQNNDYSNNLAFGYDCAQGDIYCESDFSSPVTTILPTAFGAYPANLKLRFAVQDNYPSSLIHTYFCLNISPGTCYPNELPTAPGEYTKILTQSGTYNLFYYSQDPAKNLEEVKRVTILVDADKPFITITNPSYTNFPVNQANVTIEGITSTDTRWLCVNNTLTKKSACINSCLLTSNVQPCISNQTGYFSFVIPVSNTALNNITGIAEDFAGNIYKNTLLGILLNIEPPSDANITIKGINEV